MKTPLRLLVVLAALQSLAFAGGGSEDVVADLNGWKLRIGSGGGSEAYLERESNGVHFHGCIKFQQFWDYFLILKELPRSPKNKPTKIWIADENDKSEQNPSYLDPERALPILQLMLLLIAPISQAIRQKPWRRSSTCIHHFPKVSSRMPISGLP
jgi:hypothetical protein